MHVTLFPFRFCSRNSTPPLKAFLPQDGAQTNQQGTNLACRLVCMHSESVGSSALIASALWVFSRLSVPRSLSKHENGRNRMDFARYERNHASHCFAGMNALRGLWMFISLPSTSFHFRMLFSVLCAPPRTHTGDLAAA